MSLFLIVFGVMIVLVLAMSIGVIMGREPIAGSCGGMKRLGMDVACEICGGDESKCEKESQKKKQDATLGYDAMSRPK